MSKIINLAIAANLSVASSEVAVLNPIIFKSQVIGGLSGITKDDGKYYRLNTKTNTADEITAETLTISANNALTSLKDEDGSLTLAEKFGLVTSLTFEAGNDQDVVGSSDLNALAKALDMKVESIEIASQNGIIFNTVGINQIGNLTKDDNKYYSLDTKKNVATLIDPDGVSAQATTDFLAGKSTDFTRLAGSFNLITAAKLVRK